MYEVVVSVALLMVVMALVVPQLGGATQREDEQAPFALSAVLDAQRAYRDEKGDWAGFAELGEDDRVVRVTLVAAGTESVDASTVSVSHNAAWESDDGTMSGKVGLAAAGATQCWLVSMTPTEVRWAVSSQGECTGQRASETTLEPPDDDPSRGTSPDRPIRLGEEAGGGGAGGGGGGGGGGTTTTAPSPTTTTTAPGYVSPPTAAVAGADGVDGTIEAVAVAGNTVYVGGTFTSVVDQAGNVLAARQNLAAFDATTGEFLPSFDAGANNTVLDLAVANGTVYAGGRFTQLTGQTRVGLGALDATTGAASSWRADLSSGGRGRGLAVSGPDLYVAGQFSTIAGQPRTNLARVALDDAGVDAGFTTTPNGVVDTVATSPDGTVVYIGGQFTQVAGQSRSYAAALNAADASVRSQQFSLQERALEVRVSTDNSTVVFGLGGTDTNGNRAVAASTTTGLTSWTLVCDGDVQAVHPVESSVFIGFHGGCPSHPGALALELDSSSGSVNTGWSPTMSDNPNAYAGVRDIDANAAVIAMGGSIDEVDGVAVRSLALFRLE